MTFDDPLVDILTRRILELETENKELKAKQVNVNFVTTESPVPQAPRDLQNHERCIDFLPRLCYLTPCPDCDLVVKNDR